MLFYKIIAVEHTSEQWCFIFDIALMTHPFWQVTALKLFSLHQHWDKTRLEQYVP